MRRNKYVIFDKIERGTWDDINMEPHVRASGRRCFCKPWNNSFLDDNEDMETRRQSRPPSPSHERDKDGERNV